MAQRKAHEVDSWLAKPSGDIAIVLIYGPDRGLVSERAQKFARWTGLPLDDLFCVVKLDASTLERDPGRLSSEAHAVAMFASRRLLWIRGAGAEKKFAEEIKALSKQPPVDAMILIEAGDLKKGSALRAAVEGATRAMSLPCYPEEGRDLDRLIDEELTAAGLSIAMDARQLLRGSLGGDRLASRGELNKLVLYMQGMQRPVAAADVMAAVSDVSLGAEHEAIDAMITGRMADMDQAVSRAISENALNSLALAGLRRLQLLQTLRGAVDAGAPISAAIGAARPPVFFNQRAVLEQAVGIWSAQRIERTLVRLQNLILTMRQRQSLAPSLLRQLFLTLTRESAAQKRRT